MRNKTILKEKHKKFNFKSSLSGGGSDDDDEDMLTTRHQIRISKKKHNLILIVCCLLCQINLVKLSDVKDMIWFLSFSKMKIENVPYLLLNQDTRHHSSKVCPVLCVYRVFSNNFKLCNFIRFK